MFNKILIHVGYHKTGTTWLQRSYFNENFGYIPIMDHDQVSEYIIDINYASFDNKKNILKNLLKEKNNSNLIPVISSEDLCDLPFYGGRLSKVYAERLHDVVPEAKVLITIREQISILRSVYALYITQGGTLSPKDFFREQNSPGFMRFSAEHFYYHNMVSMYREFFGEENVLVLTQEEMTFNITRFLEKISHFSGAARKVDFPASSRREGESYPEYIFPILRRINHFRAGPASPEPIIDLRDVGNVLYKGIGATSKRKLFRRIVINYRPVSDYLNQEFGNRFIDSNRALKTILGNSVDLSGYQM